MQITYTVPEALARVDQEDFALFAACHFLAQRNQDNCSEKNGIGYNGADSEFGNYWAKVALVRWTVERKLQIWHMVQKYKRQLAQIGIDPAKLPKPTNGHVKGQPIAGVAAVAQPKRVELVNGNFEVRFPYAAQTVAMVKGLPGARWNPTQKFWYMPANASSAAAICERLSDFEFSLDASEGIQTLTMQAATNTVMSKATAAVFQPENFGVELYPYQQAGALYLLDNKRTILADEMGLGKTLQTLAVACAKDTYPAFIVAPGGLTRNWRDEILRALPIGSEQIVILRSDTTWEEMRDALVLLVSYDILADGWTGKGKDKRVVLSQVAELICRMPLKLVAFDEAHAIKNPKAQRTCAVLEIVERTDPEYRFPVTGTPVLNRPIELVTLLRLIGRLDSDFGGWYKFATRYCDGHQGRYGFDVRGASNLGELNERLRQCGAMVRREKMDVLSELPDKTSMVHYVPLSNRAEYDRALNSLVSYVREQALSDEDFVAEVRKANPEMSDDEIEAAVYANAKEKAESAGRAETLQKLMKCRDLAAKGKIASAIEWINEFVAETEQKLIVFGMQAEVIDALLAAYPDAARVISAQSADERHAEVKRFQNDPNCKIIIGAMGNHAGASPAGVGWTMTAASHVLFISLGWTRGHMAQCEDRAHRIGQKDNVTAHYMLATDTIEIDMYQLIDKKARIGKAAITGEGVGCAASEDITNELLSRIGGF